MQLQTLLTVSCFFFCALVLRGQEYRSFDGSNNNSIHSDWGAVDSQMPRWTPPDYEDGISEIGGNDRPNPRAVSNLIFSQDGLVMDPRNLSDFCWVFGQFIDHDITLVHNSDEFIYVQVPEGDAHFDPWGTGAALIPMRRSQPIANSGTSASNPLQYANSITSFLDASTVYGSDVETADWLRTGIGGKLKTSTGNLLPYNTHNGQLNGFVDSTAPIMEDATGQLDKYFVAGDVRANENTLLTAMHTLFVREHNRQCDIISEQHPSWGDNLVYRHARRKVGGFISAITYEEWLPAMGVELQDYFAYDQNINPSIANEFSAAAFRLGHTLLSGSILRMDMDGNTISAGNLELKDAFFNPASITESGGVDPLFKGMAAQAQQSMDGKIVDDVRNFLFGPAGAGGLDLVAINIARGRERGLADFNTIRTFLGLEAYTDFEDMVASNELVNILENELGYTIDNLDPWVGMLIEDHIPDALFGETIMSIMERQFFNLRAGDRFYYENDEVLSEEEKAEIKSTTLHDIIMRNTDIPIMQDEIFFAMPHSQLCNATTPEAFVTGFLQTEQGDNILDVEVLIAETENTFSETFVSAELGFEAQTIPTCHTYTITPSKNTNHVNGVTTSDILAVRRHILGTVPLTSPYQFIAADANNSESITTADLLEMRKLILQISNTFQNSPAWRFVDATYQFPEPTNPWSEAFPESITTDAVQEDMAGLDFIAIKVGDVNDSANPSNFDADGEERGDGTPFVFSIEDEMLNEGNQHTVAFKAKDIADIEGFQFTLNYNTEYLEFIQLKGGALTNFGVQNFYVMPQAGAINMSWNGDEEIDPEAELFSITFHAKKGVKKICEVLTINSRYTKAEAYSRSDNEEASDLAILFNCMDGPMLVHNKFEVYQNIPNPMADQTRIGFYLPKDSAAKISITDASGRLLKVLEGDFVEGINEIELNRSDIEASGIVYYSVESEFGKGAKSMVIL